MEQKRKGEVSWSQMNQKCIIHRDIAKNYGRCFFTVEYCSSYLVKKMTLPPPPPLPFIHNLLCFPK